MFTPNKQTPEKPYSSIGVQSPSTKRTAPAFSLYSELLTESSRNHLGKQKEITPGPDVYESPKSFGKQVESQKKTSHLSRFESRIRDNLQVESASKLGPGSYSYVGSMGKHVISTKRSQTGIKWGSPTPSTVPRRRVVLHY